MKIALHSFNYSGNDAGIAIVTRNSLSRLAGRHDIHIICQNKNIITNETLKENEEMHGCHVHRISRSKIPLIGTLIYFYKAIIKIKNIHPDVFHEQELCGIGYLTKKLSGIPYLVFCHGIDVFGRQPFLTKILKKLDIKNADAVIANTLQLAETIKKKFYDRKIELIRNGINLEEFRLKKENSKGTTRFIGVGRLIPSKGFQYAIEALAIIKKDIAPFEYYIIGVGEHESELKALAKSKGVEKEIIFRGKMPHSEVVKNLARADVFLFPTHHTETCSLAILEAMASGLPIITTNFQANPELVEEGKGGFLAPTENVAALAEKIREMISDKKRMLEFGKFNKEKAKSFDWEIIAKQLEEVYHRIRK
jgi:glycosyltransferase involved in cell wall biosynthesis